MPELDEPRAGGAFEELTETECLDLLRTKSVGRIGFSNQSGPTVLPVNYVLDAGTILFRTAPYNSLAAALHNAQAAFEVDDIDDFLQGGWSVLVHGQATYVDDAGELAHDASERPEPWPEGGRPLYIRVTPRAITGRRVHPV